MCLISHRWRSPAVLCWGSSTLTFKSAVDGFDSKHRRPPIRSLSDSLSTERCKMAAASSIQPPSVHAIQRENSPHPETDSPASRQEEDAASEGTTILRDLPELDPEEIEKRLEKTRRELSNRRKILIKNLPQDTTNQVTLERFTYLSLTGESYTAH